MGSSATPPEIIHHYVGDIRVLVASADTVGAMSIIGTTIAPGRRPTWQRHSREDKVFYVV